MINKSKCIAFVLLLGFILAGCVSSNNVVSNRLIQKRKFNKGWHINSKNRVKKDNSTVKNESFQPENQKLAVNSIKPKKERIVRTSSEINSPEEENTQAIDRESNYELLKNGHLTEDADISEANSNEYIFENNEEIPTPVKKLANPYVRLNDARASYNKAWIYTAMAIVAILAGIVLLFNSAVALHVVLGVIAMALALLGYIQMFVELNKTAVSIALFMKNREDYDQKGNTLRVFTWLHVVIGSFVSIIFFLIPLLIIIKNARNAKSR